MLVAPREFALWDVSEPVPVDARRDVLAQWLAGGPIRGLVIFFWTERQFRLFRVGSDGRGDTFFFRNGEDLIRFHLRESLHFLCCRPLDFEDVDQQRFAQAEVKPQVRLRHDASSTMHFIDL